MAMFSLRLSSHTGGGGYPYTSIILPLFPCPFPGYPSDWSQVQYRGVLQLVGVLQSQVGDTPVPAKTGLGVHPPQPEQNCCAPLLPPPPRTARTGPGYPPPIPLPTTRMWRGRRYPAPRDRTAEGIHTAPCVQAGGLSCYSKKLPCVPQMIACDTQPHYLPYNTVDIVHWYVFVYGSPLRSLWATVREQGCSFFKQRSTRD